MAILYDEQRFFTSREATADYLDKVADWFEEHRWMRHKFSNSKLTQACALGAMRIVAGAESQQEAEGYNYGPNFQRSTYMDGRAALSNCLKQAEGTAFGHIPSWNDRPKMNKRKVIKAFRDCASRVRDEAGKDKA